MNEIKSSHKITEYIEDTTVLELTEDVCVFHCLKVIKMALGFFAVRQFAVKKALTEP